MKMDKTAKKNNMKKHISLTLALLLSFTISFAQNSTVEIVKGQFESEKDVQLLKTFAASKGDIITLNVKSLHKRRGVDITMVQHPGNIVVLEYQEAMDLTKKVIAPADVIYEVYYGGSKLDFEINISNSTPKPSGPGRGEVVYVRIPDTTHVSGYVNREIGENFQLTPYKERVLLNSIVITEPIANRDFITGVDLMNLYIPGDVKDEYREQKLLSYNVSLSVDAPSSYDAISGVVKAGMDAFIPDISPTKFIGKGKTKKMDPNNMYEVVKDTEKEKEKWEKTVETIKLSQELGDSVRPGSNSNADKVLATTGFLLDSDGMKEMALNNGLKAAGAPDEVMAIADKVMNIPSATDFLKDGFDKYASKIKGEANLKIYDSKVFNMDTYNIPTEEVWIQSALNYGKDGGGCWDIPGTDPKVENGLNVNCWEIDGGVDRKFKFVPSTKYKGYYEIRSSMGDLNLDNNGGVLTNNGNKMVLWKRHGGKSQVFRIEHLGNGKIRIFNYKGRVVNADGRTSKNGSNLTSWENHEGDWMNWYLINPASKTVFIPKRTGQKVDIVKEVLVTNKTAGVINETIEVSKKSDPLNLNYPYKEVRLVVNEKDYVSDAKLIVEAKYQINEYTEVIKYKKVSQPLATKDFWTAYKLNYDYAIMFKDQVKDYYEEVNSSEYKSTQRSTTEKAISGDETQRIRLAKYNILVGSKE